MGFNSAFKGLMWNTRKLRLCKSGIPVILCLSYLWC